ncbi:MAG: hypothetical protein QOD83_1582 [Solirubrobacteraceae bacterium]|jgi:hypothetical protein|nr:hypothetical protein [Solirubrobacteraceae bacterium]
MFERGLGEAKKDGLLAAYATQIADQLTLDTVLRSGADAVHELDQQIDERVGDLRCARPAQRGQQRQPDRLAGGTQIGWVQLRGARPPRGDLTLRRVGEQVGGQPDRADTLELLDLLKQCPQSDAAWIGLQFRQKPGAAADDRRVRRVADESRESQGRAVRQPRQGPGGEPRVVTGTRAAEDPLDPRGTGPLAATAAQQRVTHAIFAEFDWADLALQPAGPALLVGDGGLAKPERLADLRAVILDRAARPVIGRQLIGGDSDLVGDERDRSRWDLRAIARETRLELKELQQQREPQPSRASLVGHQRPIGIKQRPRRHELLGLPLLPHPQHPSR